MYICQNANIQSWTHTFLESGHLFPPNNTDGGKIEKIKNKNMSIFTKGEWKEIIIQLNFNGFEMKVKLYDFTGLQKYTSRKLNSEIEKFLVVQIVVVENSKKEGISS